LGKFSRGLRTRHSGLNRRSLNRRSLNRRSLNRRSLNRRSLNRCRLNRHGLNRCSLDSCSLDSCSLDSCSLDSCSLDWGDLMLIYRLLRTGLGHTLTFWCGRIIILVTLIIRRLGSQLTARDHDAKIMFGVLEKILSGDAVTRQLRITRHRQVFFIDLISCTANFALGTTGIKCLIARLLRPIVITAGTITWSFTVWC
jgi:hypothetical protein